jgi:hypothetical protein
MMSGFFYLALSAAMMARCWSSNLCKCYLLHKTIVVVVVSIKRRQRN